MTVGYSTAVRNAKADALTTYIGSAGKMGIYTAPKPATGGALGGATLLATLTLGTPFAPAAVGGVITANAITSGVAVASGTGAWARIFKADGTTICADLDVAVSGKEVTIANTSIVSGAVISVSSCVITSGNP